MARPATKRARLRPGQMEVVELAHLSAAGDGVGELDDGTAVHVPGGLPTEHVRVRITQVSRHAPRAHATLVELLRPSPARRQPPCRHQGRCDGCPLMIADEAAQLGYKEASLRRLHGLVVDRWVEEPDGHLGYRCASKRVVGGRPGQVRLGSFRRRSHELVSMAGCLVDHPAIAAAAREVGRVASRLGIAPYREADGEGQLRYAWFKTNERGEVLVCLVLAEPRAALAADLAARLGRPAGVAWSTQESAGNALRGADARPLAGTQELRVDLGTEVRVGPLGFLQPNPRVAARAYADLVAGPLGAPIAGGSLAVDLYAGAGATTALLRQRFREVVACEAFPESAARLGVAPVTAEQTLARLLGRGPTATPVELLVANPPRAGLGAEAATALAALAPRRVHLMSCSPAALRRDLDRLLAPAGPYRLLGVRGYDTLPQTPHVELVAWLELRAG